MLVFYFIQIINHLWLLRSNLFRTFFLIFHYFHQIVMIYFVIQLNIFFLILVLLNSILLFDVTVLFFGFRIHIQVFKTIKLQKNSTITNLILVVYLLLIHQLKLIILMNKKTMKFRLLTQNLLPALQKMYPYQNNFLGQIQQNGIQILIQLTICQKSAFSQFD